MPKRTPFVAFFLDSKPSDATNGGKTDIERRNHLPIGPIARDHPPYFCGTITVGTHRLSRTLWVTEPNSVRPSVEREWVPSTRSLLSLA